MKRIVVLAMLVLTGLSSLATGQENRNQAKENMPKIPKDVSIEENVVFGKGGGRDLTMHILSPKQRLQEPAPVFVWIHGGGWQGGRKESGIYSMVPFVRRGFVSVTIEYRLTGEAPFPAQIEDCKCAIRYLRAHADKYQIDPDRIAVGGASAGGHLAALVGTSGGVDELEGSGGWPKQSSQVQAVVDLYGPTDFELFVTAKGYEKHNRDGSPESKLLGGGTVLENREGIRQVNPITYIDKDDPPFFIIHGSDDPTVPLNQSKALQEALGKMNVDCKLHIIEGAKHGGPEFREPELRRMQVDFVSRVLSK
ncbi:MAG: alpha/beta hydrolase fold domain-containing protein [Aureliella sp.]